MWKKKKVALVLATYKEKDSIYQAIKDFKASGFIDEIIVVENNAELGTEEEVKKTRARLFHEKRQGFGYAIRKGMNKTKADLIIISEPDGTYAGRDVIKFLAYSDDFEMVFGSRTHLPLVQKDSDMTFVKRYGDVLLGKLTTLLFNCSPLTDMGCAYRITTRKTWGKIKNECWGADNIFSTEWVCAAAKNKIKFMEIPVNFQARIGESTVSGTSFKRIMWGIRKFFCIWRYWLLMVFGKKAYH